MAQFGKRGLAQRVNASRGPAAPTQRNAVASTRIAEPAAANASAPNSPTSADVAVAIEAIATGKLPFWAVTGPLRLIFTAVAGALGLWLFILPYTGDLLRDYRLAGTWQPAYDLQVVDGKCTRYQFVLTVCDAKIRSHAEPNRPPVAAGFIMALSRPDGEFAVPVRSRVDPSKVAVAYAAETKTFNRTLTLLFFVACFAALILVIIQALLRGRYIGGAAHRRLMVALEDAKTRVETMQAAPRATA